MRPSAFRRTAVAALVVILAAGMVEPSMAKPGKRKGPKHKVKTPREVVDVYYPRCAGNPDDVTRLDMYVNGSLTWGLYAMPPTPAKGIVVVGHGYGHTPESWRKHLTTIARRNNVVAVGMNYRDTWGGSLPDTRGWEAHEGAEDSIAAAQLFQRACPTAHTIVMYGVSMGGNIAGLAVAYNAKRSNGKPLFDYLFDIEGAVNVTETYLEARGLAQSGNQFAKDAVADIEREMGGKFEDKRDVYLDRTVVNRVDDIAAAGIKGVVMVHGVDDGLVGYNQSPEFLTRLRQAGVPVDFWTAVTRGEDSEPGTTLDGYVTGSIPGYTSPFAGHASEASETHIVGVAGFERLAALFRGEAPACRTGVLDGTLGFGAKTPFTSPATC
ncbi:MAG TPA: alpha/beta hydrolase [Frankiaceae bacterium]|nr:alpha/beta hydrolase [Frankiaceae bacterium]